MPPLPQPLSDETRNACGCRAHDCVSLDSASTIVLRTSGPVPTRPSAFAEAHPLLFASMFRAVTAHAMIASGASCEARHRAGSGVTIVQTHPARLRFPELGAGGWFAANGEGDEA